MTYAATPDQLTSQARKVRSVSPGRVIATLVTVPFFVLGWLIGLVVTGVVLLWSAAAVGFQSGRSVSPTRRHEGEQRPDRRHIA